MPNACFLVERLFPHWAQEIEAALERGEALDFAMVAGVTGEAQRARLAEERLRKACGEAVRLLREDHPEEARHLLEAALEMRNG